jgi:hypothetical protein
MTVSFKTRDARGWWTYAISNALFGVSARDTGSGTAKIIPSLPLSRFERILASIFAVALTVAIFWLFIFQVSSAGIMLEYVFKFLPAMTDGGPASIFDGNTIGDPRPRLLTTFFTYVNIALRRALLLHSPNSPHLRDCLANLSNLHRLDVSSDVAADARRESCADSRNSLRGLAGNVRRFRQLLCSGKTARESDNVACGIWCLPYFSSPQ